MKFIMSIISIIILVLISISISYSKSNLTYLDCQQNTSTADSSFEQLDSVIVKFGMLSDASFCYITIKEKTIKVINALSGLERKLNADSTQLFKHYIDVLFVSGKEKTEIGRTYRSKLIFYEEPNVIINLYKIDGTHIIHKINLAMDTCDIEFSNTFKKFLSLLNDLCKIP